MARFFISYRRSDSAQIVGRIHEYLARYFGPESVFVDIDDIPPAVNFKEHMTRHLSQTDALIAVTMQDHLKTGP